MTETNLPRREFRASTSDLREAFAQIPEREFNAVWNALIDDLRNYANRLITADDARRITFTATKLAQNALFVLLVNDNFRTYLASQNPPIPDWDAIAQRELTPDEQRSVVRALGQQMRFALRDRARERRLVKHGGQFKRVSLDEALRVGVEPDPDVMLHIEDEIVRLEREGRAREAQAFSLVRIFGLSIAQAATTLDVSDKTVQRDIAAVSLILERRLSG